MDKLTADKLAQVKNAMKVFVPFETIMRTVMLDMIEDKLSKDKAMQIISDICYEVKGDPGFDWRNEFREWCLQADKTPEEDTATTLDDFPDPMDVLQFSLYIGKSVSWVYENSTIVPKTQSKLGEKLLFYKMDVDRWLAKRKEASDG